MASSDRNQEQPVLAGMPGGLFWVLAIGVGWNPSGGKLVMF